MRPVSFHGADSLCHSHLVLMSTQVPWTLAIYSECHQDLLMVMRRQLIIRVSLCYRLQRSREISKRAVNSLAQASERVSSSTADLSTGSHRGQVLQQAVVQRQSGFRHTSYVVASLCAALYPPAEVMPQRSDSWKERAARRCLSTKWTARTTHNVPLKSLPQLPIYYR